jgi:ABC-type antimicrobial peptide transport system permease subunit
VYVNSVVYIPYRQDAAANASLLVRSALPPGSVMEAVRREVQAIDPDQPVHAMQTLQQMLAATRWWYRSFGAMFGIFAVIALVLSSVGLYAVMAYSVTQRTQEIGVRMAVGAQVRQVWWMILKRGLVQLAIALPFGLAGALGMGVMLERMLVGMTPGDPTTFVAVTSLLIVVALAACLLPALRATRVDPVEALRAD